MCVEDNRHVGMMRHRQCKGGRARGFGLTASNTKLIWKCASARLLTINCHK